MFIRISRVNLAVHKATGITNPEDPNSPLLLNIFRTHARAGIYKVYSKKAFGEYYGELDNKRIARRNWTPEMKAFLKEKLSKTPKPPYVFKLTVLGWILLLLVIVVFGMIAYQELKPPVAKSTQYLSMEKQPQVGDIYFGHVEIYKQKGSPLGVQVMYGWFKITDINGATYFLASSTEIHKGYKPKESMNSIDFERQSLPAVQLTEQTGYNLRFKSSDGLIEAYFTDKK